MSCSCICTRTTQYTISTSGLQKYWVLCFIAVKQTGDLDGSEQSHSITELLFNKEISANNLFFWKFNRIIKYKILFAYSCMKDIYTCIQ